VDVESFADVLDIETELVRAWEDGLLVPSEARLAALWGALQIDFDCDSSMFTAWVRPFHPRFGRSSPAMVRSVRQSRHS
jgi:hypothetical protein